MLSPRAHRPHHFCPITTFGRRCHFRAAPGPSLPWTINTARPPRPNFNSPFYSSIAVHQQPASHQQSAINNQQPPTSIPQQLKQVSTMCWLSAIPPSTPPFPPFNVPAVLSKDSSLFTPLPIHPALLLALFPLLALSLCYSPHLCYVPLHPLVALFFLTSCYRCFLLSTCSLLFACSRCSLLSTCSRLAYFQRLALSLLLNLLSFVSSLSSFP